MTPAQSSKLMKQILRMYTIFGNVKADPEHAAMALNGLFNIAKTIDPHGMNEAFKKGLDAARNAENAP